MFLCIYNWSDAFGIAADARSAMSGGIAAQREVVVMVAARPAVQLFGAITRVVGDAGEFR